MTSESGEQFKQYMMRRVFGIIAVVDKPRSASERFPLCSGVVVEIGNVAVLLTVAHYLKDVKRWRQEGRLLDLKLIVIDTSGGCSYATIDLDSNPIAYHLESDFGIVVLSNTVVEHVIKRGGKAVVPMPFLFSELPDHLILVGHSARNVKRRTETIASDRASRVAWQLETPTTFAVAFVTLELKGLGINPQTVELIPIGGIDDYVGLSGGPIFAYKEGAMTSDYRFFGIQSKQVREAKQDGTVSHLIATSGAFAIQSVTALIDSFET